MSARWRLLALLTCCLTSTPLFAQPADRVEIGAGGLWIGASHFPVSEATQGTPGGGRRVVFRTASTLESSLGLAVRVGLKLRNRLSLESTLSLNHPDFSTRVSGDVEGAADTTASEPVTQYLIEGGVRFDLARGRSKRLRPFATAGSGYLRQLNDGQTLADTGWSWYVGGGAYYFLNDGGRGRIKSSGLRFDARATGLERGVAPDQGSHLVPTLGAGFFVTF